jgi:hypothetical protein
MASKEGATKNSSKFNTREVASNPINPQSVSAPDSGANKSPFTYDEVSKSSI